jgi:glycosyltransferase involved in cell wall biosynthesis
MSTDAMTARGDGRIQSGRDRVTIFVPTYNRSQWLGNAIESALSQTYGNFVLIVSDNCSTDDTREVVESFEDPRLVYVRQPEHLDLNEHFNLCYGLARTDYVFLIPDDDVMAPDALERMIPVLDANPEVGLVHGCARLVDETGATIESAHHMTQLAGDEIESGADFIRRAVDQGYRVHASTALIRAAALADVRLRDDEFPVTDVGLWLRLALSWNLAFLNRPLAVVRIHSGAYTADGRGLTGGGYVQQTSVIEKLLEVKLRFIDEFEDRLSGVDELRETARRARRRDLLDLAGHLTIPERRVLETVRALGELGRLDPGIFGERRTWRLLGASVLGRRAVERLKRRAESSEGLAA